MNRLNIKLVEQAIVGDKEAFTKLVDCYKNTVYSLALSRVCNTADAEDLTQDVFLQAFVGIHTLKDASRFPQWLRGIALNKCKMWKRGRRETCFYDASESEEEVESEAMAPSFYTPSFEEELERRELHEEVLSAVYALPESNRVVVLLYYFDEMSQKEIAEFLGTSVTAVETRLHRAKKQLREEMVKRMEVGLNGQKLSDDFTRNMQRAILERFEQLIEQNFELSSDDTVVIYHDLGVHDSWWAPLRLQGSDKGYVSIRKNFLGNTLDEARERQGQIKIVVEKQQNFFDCGFLEGEMWGGIQKEKDGFYPIYMFRKEFWEKLKAFWQEKDKEAYTLFEHILRTEVMLIAAAGDRLDSVEASHEEADGRRFFRPHISTANSSMGPAGNVEMIVHIPPCRNVVFIGNGMISVKDLNANFILFSYDEALFFYVNGIQGNIQAYGAIPIKLEKIRGDVIINNPFCFPGVGMEGDTLGRISVPSQIRHIAGALRISCKELNLDISGVQGIMQIENLFGSTKVHINIDDTKFDFRSISGSISVVLSKEADEKLSVGMWTECGTINYKKWGKEDVFQASNPSIIYAGSLPPNNSEQADVKIRTQCGAITIEKE